MKVDLFVSNTYIDAFDRQLQDLKENFDKNSKYIFVVPSKFSLSVEKYIMEALSIDCYVNIEVTTMMNLASTLLDFDNTQFLNKSSSVMVINKIAIECKDELLAFSSAINKNGFCENVYATINQLKSCNISSSEFGESLTKQKLIDSKIKDIALLYKKYDEYLSSNMLDSNKRFDLFIDKIATSEYFADKKVYFCLFDSFTEQMYNILEQIIAHSKSTNLSVCYENSAKNKHIFENRIYQRLNSMCKKNGYKLDEHKFLSPLSGVFEHLSKNLFSTIVTKSELIDDDIELFCSSNVKNEIEYVAQDIMSKVQSGQSYKDFYVLANDFPTYKDAILKVFNEYNFNYYVDEKYNLSQYNITKFIFSFLQIVTDNFELNDMISFCKNIFCKLSSEQMASFENISIKYDLNGKELFNFKCQDEKTESIYKEIANVLLNKIDLEVKEFKKAKTVKEKVDRLFNLFDNFDCFTIEQNILKDFSKKGDFQYIKFCTVAKQKLYDILNQLKDILGDSILDNKTFVQMLKSSFDETKFNIIPQGVDEIFVGDFTKMLPHKVPNMYVLGANQNSMPAVKNDCGLLTDEDIVKMGKSNIINPSIEQLNHLSVFNCFQTLLLCSKRLCIGYAQQTPNAFSNKPSNVTKAISSIFYTKDTSYLQIINSEDVLTNYSHLKNNSQYDFEKYLATKKSALYKYLKMHEDALVGLSAIGGDYLITIQDYFNNNKINTNKFDKIVHENIKNLKVITNSVSASHVEHFYQCPYKSYVDSNLKLKPKQENELENIDFGNVLHSVAEKFVEEYIKNAKLDIEKFAELIFLEEMKAYSYYSSNKRNGIPLKIFKNEVISLCKKLAYILQNTSYKVKSLEQTFNVPMISLNGNKSNENITIKGKIDRIDEWKNYITIIDYKSGSNKFSLKDLYLGQKVQLPLYSLIASKMYDKKISGCYYYGMKNSLRKKDDSTINTYSGITLFNNETIKAMDNTFEENKKSSLLKLEITEDKNGTLKIGGDLYADDEIKLLQDYCLKLVENAVEKLQQGYIECNPYKDLCERCEYRTICRYHLNKEIAYRKIDQTIKINSIKEAMERND